MPTIFEKIISGEIPSTKVYEDDKCIAILDVNPVADGHLLLIPKEHYKWIQGVPDELISYLFIKAKDLIEAQKSGLGCDYVQISVVGKDVPHVHIHLIPRYFDDGLEGWETHQYKDNEAEPIAAKISENL